MSMAYRSGMVAARRQGSLACVDRRALYAAAVNFIATPFMQ